MPMTTPQQDAWNVLGSAEGVLNDRIVAFVAAHTATQAAVTAEEAAKIALDAAWVDSKSKETSFDAIMYVPPEGYTPPT
jgi:hypothetical protein